MTLQDAKNFISFGIKEGHFEEDWFKGMTDGELIGFAQDQELKADANFEELQNKYG